MGSKIEYVESSHLYATNYVRNSKAIGVLWAIFTICYAIISVVAFVTPEWIGDLETEYPRKFGLWQVCRADEAVEDCKGRLDDFMSINGLVFKIATVLVGIAVALALFTICAMLLFFFCQSTTVFHICGWMQLLSGEFHLKNVLIIFLRNIHYLNLVKGITQNLPSALNIMNHYS